MLRHDEKTGPKRGTPRRRRRNPLPVIRFMADVLTSNIKTLRLEAGQTFVGVYRRLDHIVTADGGMVSSGAIFEGDDGEEYALLLGGWRPSPSDTALRSQLGQLGPQPGDRIAVKNLGEQTAADGRTTYTGWRCERLTGGTT